MNIDIIELMSKLKIAALEFTPKLIAAILILFLGLWLVKRIIKFSDKMLSRSGISVELSKFLLSIATIVLKIIVIVIAASLLGFEVSSLIGVLAGLVFAIGLALQGFLGNFAAGITIVFFKPYKVGDWVQIEDNFGKVEEIQIFYTILKTPGNKTLIIPNGQVSDHVITNFSTLGKIRLELSVLMPYSESFPKVKQVIMNALDSIPLIMKEPIPLIGIETFDSHNVVLSVRPYINPDYYWKASFQTMSAIKKALHDAGIEMAYSEGV